MDIYAATSIQYFTGGFNQCHKTRKRNESQWIGKVEVKLSLLANDMIMYIENTRTNKWI